ncbi:hypothetical protein [Nonomuraea candida]|uniref:hypothetical protein n=1 Tax=Nonomuraea candida TaxID=359159 RepID=UPI000A6D46FF|nr:hypothetical protein [Nonomuraea candida]
MGSRTAISAGVLAVALAAVPVAAPAASAAVQDCTRGGGLLSGVTDALCEVVDVVTGTVDTLTGGTTEKVTGGLDKATDEVLGRVGEAVPTTRSSPGRPTLPAPSRSTTPKTPQPGRTGLVPDTLGDVCLPVLACEDQRVMGRQSPSATSSPASSAGARTGRGWVNSPAPAPTATATATATAPRTTRPESTPQLVDTGRPVPEKRTAHAEEPRVDLLWPNPFAHELAVPMQDQRVVRPSPPASDVLGTVLTIALLGSAVLATRIVQQRRQRSEPSESIPFEPARAGNSRHRLA